MASKVGLVAGHEELGGGLDPNLELGKLADFRAGHEQWPVLGPDRMVWGHHAGLCIAGEFFTVDNLEDGGAGTELKDEPAISAILAGGRQAEGPAHNRRHIG